MLKPTYIKGDKKSEAVSCFALIQLVVKCINRHRVTFIVGRGRNEDGIIIVIAATVVDTDRFVTAAEHGNSHYYHQKFDCFHDKKKFWLMLTRPQPHFIAQ
jgi:hypothetical protein